ncbi:uncharacterized protein LOC144108205 [Amblyomma americanum]
MSMNFPVLTAEKERALLPTMRSDSSESESHDDSSSSPIQAEDEAKRKDPARRTNVSAAARHPESKQDASKAHKGSREKRQSVSVDSKQPRRGKQHDAELSSFSRTGVSVGRDDWKASTAVVPFPQDLPLVESRRPLTAPQSAHERPAYAEVRKLHSLPSNQADSGSPQSLAPRHQEAAPTMPESTKAVRKSSKSSVGGLSTASGRQQASTLSESRSKSRASRTDSKAALRGPVEALQHPLGPAGPYSPGAMTQAAPVPAQAAKTEVIFTFVRPACPAGSGQPTRCVYLKGLQMGEGEGEEYTYVKAFNVNGFMLKTFMPESTKAGRRSSKSSVGGLSTASGRQQASTLSESRSKSRASRTGSKATMRGPVDPPQDPVGPAGSYSPGAGTQAAPVPAQTALTEPSQSGKEHSRNRPTTHALGHPKGEIRRQPSTKHLAQPTASRVEEPASKQRPSTGGAVDGAPDASRASRSSRASRASQKRSVSEKAPAPTHHDGRAIVASPSRRSVASTASRRSRTSRSARHMSGVSKGSSRHRRSHHGARRADLGDERDHSAASVLSLAGSRVSVASSKRSLRPIGPEEELKPKRRVLLMPDGTYVGLSEKNRWLRAMHTKYLGWDYRTCTLKAGFGVMLLGFIYILMFRQDLLLQMAIFVRDNVYDPDATAGTIFKHKYENTTTKYENTTTAGKYHHYADATKAPQATKGARREIRDRNRTQHGDSSHQ